VASAEEVLEVDEVVDEAEEEVEGTYVFSFREDIVILGKVVNSHTIFLGLAVVEVVSGAVETTAAVKLLEDPGSHHMADSRDKQEDTSRSKEVVVGSANQWVQVEVINNKEVLLVTVSQIVTEVRALSQVVTVVKVVSHLVMAVKGASQPVSGVRADSQVVLTVVVELDSKMATVVGDTIKHRRIATPSLWDVEDTTSNRVRLPLGHTDNRTVMHNKELEGKVTPHPRVFIVNNQVDIQGAVLTGNKEEEEEVPLAAMDHHLEEEEDGQEDIRSIEKNLTACVAVFTNFIHTFCGNLLKAFKNIQSLSYQGCYFGSYLFFTIVAKQQSRLTIPSTAN